MIDFVDDSNPSNRLSRKIPNDLKALNNLLEQSSTSFYYDQREPTIADYFVFEAFTMARDYSKKLVPQDDCRALMQLEQVMRERPALANYFHRGALAKRFTGFPKETDYLTKLAQTSK